MLTKNASPDDAARPDTWIVVPCFNEAARLDVAAFEEFVQQNPTVAVLFIDDGSTDDTLLVVERLRQRQPHQIRTFRLAQNAGKAEAVRQGMQIAFQERPEFVGYWDADLATPLGAIVRFGEILERRGELNLVMGSRVALLGRKIQRSGVRHILGRLFATAASFVLRLPVYDTQCGAKLFRVTPQANALFATPFRSRWIFDVELLARFVSPNDGYTNRLSAIRSIYEYPLETWHDVGGSRLKPRDFALAAFELAAIHWQYMRRTTAKPGVRQWTPVRSTAERRAAA